MTNDRHAVMSRRGTPRRLAHFVIVLLAQAPLAACYTVQPLRTTAPSPETRVVAHLTDEGIVEMAPQIGSGALEVEGIVASATDAEWKLELTRVEHRDGQSVPWKREPVTFPRRVLDAVEEHRFDRGRSYAFAVGITLGAFVMARLVQIAIGEGDRLPPGGEPPALRVPVGR